MALNHAELQAIGNRPAQVARLALEFPRAQSIAMTLVWTLANQQTPAPSR